MSSFVCVQHGDSTPDDIDSDFTVIKSGEHTVCGNDDSHDFSHDAGCQRNEQKK